ncbi:MAG: ABC transporter ATP-binding protein [Clostridia bacterium]|nr:ABC transporter ATP-binding protein [Clostridia bacterium]
MTIKVQNISKSFKATRALDNVSFTLEPNKIYGLLGNNGAGKTTLLNIITGRLIADNGLVQIDGESNYNNDNALSKCFLLSADNLYPSDMKVNRAYEATKLFQPNFDEAYAIELAKRFELPLNKKITALSTGYASIFRLTIALAVGTPYLFLDEPVLGLDAQHRDLFYKLLIERFAENPSTIVVSTHLIGEVANLLEQTIIIRNGRIIENLPNEQMLSGGYTVSGPALAVKQFTADKKVISQTALGGLLTVCLQGQPPANLPAGLEISRLNLQDYFINLMNKEDGQNE